MRADVDRRSPEEACGLLAGRWDRAIQVIPIPNMLHSMVRFRMDPEDQWAAFKRIEDQGLELVGIYHSHPAGPQGPSQTDIQESYYPEAAYLIWSVVEGDWHCRAYRIQGGAAHEMQVSLTKQE